MSDENAVIIEAWNTVLYDKFVRFRYLLTTGLDSHSEEAFRRHAHPDGSKVLDVGCGFGETTREIAKRVGTRGLATGVDCAANFVRSATDESEKAGVKNSRFFVADVQSEDLQGPYDHAFARFGTMFFNLPGAAIRNVRRALTPGGTFTMIVWRKREDNPWLHEAEKTVRGIVPVVEHDQTDAVHCGPGPFSMAGPDMVSDMLHYGGYDRIAFERFDTDICIGRDMDEAIAFAMALGPAGEIIRLAGAEGEKRRGQVDGALRDALAKYQTENGVWAPSSSWFVTARNASK